MARLAALSLGESGRPVLPAGVRGAPMSTISTTITTGVTLGSGSYPSPLTVTSSGYIN
jgi:hypothetical protein